MTGMPARHARLRSTALPAAPSVGERGAFRFDVEGMRTVAIALVAIYHVWGAGRVSGGVDVFLMISGFFVGGAVLRRIQRGTGLRLGSYYARLLRRLLPPLLLTLAAVVVGAWCFLPQSTWSQVSDGVLASVAYVENWRMAIAGQAYAAADAMSSPVQHIWSLSVQGQIFLGLPLLLLAVATLLRATGVSERALARILVGFVAVLAAASFGYAVVRVAVNQDVTYFDTGARLWEYLTGTLVAVLLTRWRPRAGLAVALGWLGMAMVLSTGLLLDARGTFPGVPALMPIVGAALVVVAGHGGADSPGAVGRLLAWGPLARAGSYAYEFYLWHWVVLVFALAITGVSSFGVASGVLVLLIAAAISWGARTLVAPITRPVSAGTRPSPPWYRRGLPRALVAGALALVLLAPSGWLVYRQLQPWTGESELDAAVHPGALTLLDADRWPSPAEVEVVPSILDAGEDWPFAGREDCHSVGKLGTEVERCVFGDLAGSIEVALVGGSHAMNFAEPLDAVARQSGVRIVGYIKQGCPLALWATEPEDDVTRSCAQWNENVLAAIENSDAVGVITTGTRPASETGQVGAGDYVPATYLAAWERLIGSGLEVVAIRDNPWFPFNARTCVEQAGATSTECAVDRALVLGEDDLSHALASERFWPLDLTDAICEPETCHPVVGNVLTYIDSNHLTATFSRTLAPALAEAMGEVSWWP